MPDLSYESALWARGEIVAGIDEAGRGAIAGPVVAAAAIIPRKGFDCRDIDDSKKLAPEKREYICREIQNSLDCFSYSFIDNDEIDRINILEATFKAMSAAVDSLSVKPSHLLIDGNRYNNTSIPFTTVIGGDAISTSISAASIIAKVLRDKWMAETAHKLYPDYGFDRHKGYGTRSHYEAIENIGPCPLHRTTFLRKFFSRQYRMF